MEIVKLETKSCTRCPAVSGFLEDQGVDFTVYDLEDNPDKGMEFGAMSVPVTILLDEGNEIQRVTGFHPPQLEELVSKYKGE